MRSKYANEIKKNNKGFTLIELIVTMLLLSILLGLTVSGILSWQDWSDFNQANEYAEAMFSAAQNQLSEYDANGTLEDFADKVALSKYSAIDLMTEDNSIDAKIEEFYYTETEKKTRAEVWGSSDPSLQGTLVAVRADKGDYTRYKSDPSTVVSKSAPIVFELLEQYFYDTTMLDGAILIEFSPSDGQVFSVFYSAKSNASGYEHFKYDNDSDTNLVGDVNIAKRYESYRRERMVGYYGVGTLSRAQVTAKQTTDITVALVNAETLNLEITLQEEVDPNLEDYEITIKDENENDVLAFTLAGSDLSTAAADQKPKITRCDSGSTLTNFPILAWLTEEDDTSVVHVVLDAADLQATSASYIEQVVDNMTDGVASAETINQSTFKSTYSFHRFGISAEQITCAVSLSGQYVTEGTKLSNKANVYFADRDESTDSEDDTTATSSGYTYEYDIANGRHLYNMRFVTDLSDEWEGASSTTTELRRSNSKYKDIQNETDTQIVSNFKLVSDINWGEFASYDDEEVSGYRYYYNTGRNGITASSDGNYDITTDFVSMKQLRATDSFTGLATSEGTESASDETVHTISNLTITTLGNDLSGLYGEESTDTTISNYKDVDCTFDYYTTNPHIDKSSGRYEVTYNIWGRNTSSVKITDLYVLVHIDYEVNGYDWDRCTNQIGEEETEESVGSGKFGNDISLGVYKKTENGVKNTGVEKTWRIRCTDDGSDQSYSSLLVNNNKDDKIVIASFKISFKNETEYQKFNEGMETKKYWIKFSYEGGVNSVINSAGDCYITTVLQTDREYAGSNFAARFYTRIWNYSIKEVKTATVTLEVPKGVTVCGENIENKTTECWEYISYWSCDEDTYEDKNVITVTYKFTDDMPLSKVDQSGNSGTSKDKGLYIPLQFENQTVYRQLKGYVEKAMQNRTDVTLQTASYTDENNNVLYRCALTYEMEKEKATSSKCYVTLDTPLACDDVDLNAKDPRTLRDYKITIHNESTEAMTWCYLRIKLSSGMIFYYDSEYGVVEEGTIDVNGDYYQGEQSIKVNPNGSKTVASGGTLTYENFYISGGVLDITDITLFYSNGDGNGASGITQKDLRKPIGLFATCAGTISDMKLQDIQVTASDGYAGAFCGILTCDGDGTTTTGSLTNLAVKSTKKVTDTGFGSTTSTTSTENSENSYSYVDGNGSYVGGIAGYVDGFDVDNNDAQFTLVLSNLTNEAKVTGTSYVGGIVSALETGDKNKTITVTDCKNSGEVYAKNLKEQNANATYRFIGGIVGLCGNRRNLKDGDAHALITITNCTSTALYCSSDLETILGMGEDDWGDAAKRIYYAESAVGDYVGGIVGYSYDTTLTEVSTPDSSGSAGYVIGRYYVGGIAGYMGYSSYYNDAKKKLSDATNTSTVIGCAYVGGIVGANADVDTDATMDLKSDSPTAYDAVKFVANAENNSAATDIQILAAEASATVLASCTNKGAIYAVGATKNTTGEDGTDGTPAYAGGITGYNSGAVTDAANEATITARGNYTGGIAGYNSGTIEETKEFTSKVTLDVVGSYAGGIAGCNTGTITAEKGIDITLTTGTGAEGSNYIGGIAGYNQAETITTDDNDDNLEPHAGTIKLSGEKNKVTISGPNEENSTGKYSYVGGIAGYNSASGDETTSATTTSAGTISTTGENTITISNITGDYVGGIAGYNGGTVTASAANTVTLTVTGDYVGGLVGWNAGTITTRNNNATLMKRGDNDQETTNATTTCSVKAAVTGTSYVGGLIGYNGSAAKVENYTVEKGSKITGAETGYYVGGLVGCNASIDFLQNSTSPTESASPYQPGSGGQNSGYAKTLSVSELTVSGGYFVGGVIGANIIDTNDCTSYPVTERQTTTGKPGSSDEPSQNATNQTYYRIYANVSASNNTVSGNSYVGGFIGYLMLTTSSGEDSEEEASVDGEYTLAEDLKKAAATSEDPLGAIIEAEEKINKSTTVQFYVGGSAGNNGGPSGNPGNQMNGASNDDGASNKEGSVTATGSYAGGFIGGASTGTWIYVNGATNSASVTAKATDGCAGGILGLSAYKSNKLSSCANSGAIKAEFAGAMIGYLSDGEQNSVIGNGCRNSGTINGANGNTGRTGDDKNSNMVGKLVSEDDTSSSNASTGDTNATSADDTTSDDTTSGDTTSDGTSSGDTTTDGTSSGGTTTDDTSSDATASATTEQMTDGDTSSETGQGNAEESAS